MTFSTLHRLLYVLCLNMIVELQTIIHMVCPIALAIILKEKAEEIEQITLITLLKYQTAYNWNIRKNPMNEHSRIG